MKLLTIPFTETQVHLGTVWATLSSTTKGTDKDDNVQDTRVGAVAIRLVEDNKVVATTVTGIGAGMEPHATSDMAMARREIHNLTEHNAQLEEVVEAAVEAAPDDTPEPQVGLKLETKVPADFQPTTGIKPKGKAQPQPAADPEPEDDAPSSNDFSNLTEAQLMSMTFE
jgi:hypothetical protein